jgi:hypothetical protein
VTEYLGYEIIRNREVRTTKMVQSGYSERVLKTFDMCDCNLLKTPLDAKNLAFNYSQLSKFVQYTGMVHLKAAEYVLQFVRVTYDQGISYYDLGPDKRNKLGGWSNSNQ